MNWSHGTYIINADNSINMTTFGDGYQQVQDPCAAVTNFIENYNYNESYTGYVITTDPTTGSNILQLYNFDGSPVAPQGMISSTPNMLPLQKLRNVTEAPSSNVIAKRSAAHPRWSQSNALLFITVLITTVLGGVAGPMLL
jgi:Chaperone for protein-folding within the ER, fungal